MTQLELALLAVLAGLLLGWAIAMWIAPSPQRLARMARRQVNRDLGLDDETGPGRWGL